MPKRDDDDEKWIYRDHTSAKHEVLHDYLIPWTNKLTTYNERSYSENRIRIVDCFAGRGSYLRAENTEPFELEHLSTPAEIPGSPQIILDQLTDRHKEFETAECHFIEATEGNFEILEETLDDTTNIAENIEYDCHPGEFQNQVLDVIEATDGSDCPTFFFIDPFGFQSLDYDVITEIGSTPQFEFLITFMSRDINRFFEVEDHEAAMNTVFGETDFREGVRNYDPKNWESIVEYYTTRLEENGPEHTFEYLIKEPDSKRTVYYLVFGTNHRNGLHTMREVMAGCGTGRFAYAPKNPQYDREQQTLSVGSESTGEFLLERFASYRIEFRDLVETCSEERKYQEETTSDYREALRELEDKGEISITRLASTNTGIGRGDLIDFPTSN